MFMLVHNDVAFIKKFFVHDRRYDVSVNRAVRSYFPDVFFVADYPCKTVHIERRTGFRLNALSVQPCNNFFRLFAVFVSCKNISDNIRFVTVPVKILYLL